MINPVRLIYVLFMWVIALGSIDVLYQVTLVLRDKAINVHQGQKFSLKRWNDKLHGKYGKHSITEGN